MVLTVQGVIDFGTGPEGACINKRNHILTVHERLRVGVFFVKVIRRSIPLPISNDNGPTLG